MVAACLEVLGVFPHDTRDALGEERFHPFMPAHHLAYR
jgi:glycoprotein-N-acetylgalactosamine 3-beta-galactosyltransferase